MICLAVVLTAGAVHRAAAIEIQCIEASKYKHLYRIFDDDPKKFAAFMQVDPSRLPGGETCRAILVTGRINSTKQSKDAGQIPDGDKLIAEIGKQQGWLATLYLASPGGSVGMGLALAQITRMFWLKVRSPAARSFTYRPDFFPLDASGGPQIPPDLARGWEAYSRAVQPFAQVSVTSGSGRCASACTFMHAAGIDRVGTAHVHRGRPGKVRDSSGKMVDSDQPLADSLESLHRAEASVLALYRNMDSGDAFIRLFQSTPTATVTPATTDRFPRYLMDALSAKCRLRRARNEAATPPAPGPEEQCIAAVHEKERLSQFAKYCGKGCDRKLIADTVRAKIRQLRPPDDGASRSPSRQPRSR
jgi:hypothetical protein